MNEAMVGRFLLLLCDSNHAVCIIVVCSIAATPGSLHGPSVRVTQTPRTPESSTRERISGQAPAVG